jgi:hypothetical protein
MPRYVILRHEFPTGQKFPVGQERSLHWDLMLESDGVLRTWSLADEPLSRPTIRAEQLADHRVAYLDYQGLVSGDRGSVTRWDAGAYHIDRESADHLQIMLAGQRLSGGVTLERTEPAGHFWRVSFSVAPTTG